MRQRVEQPFDALDRLSAELLDIASRDVQEKRSEAARQIERAQNRIVFILPAVGGLTIVVALLLGFGITQSITRPLRSLVDGGHCSRKRRIWSPSTLCKAVTSLRNSPTCSTRLQLRLTTSMETSGEANKSFGPSLR